MEFVDYYSVFIRGFGAADCTDGLPAGRFSHAFGVFMLIVMRARVAPDNATHERLAAAGH